MTAEEFRAWYEARGWSQLKVAEVLGLGDPARMQHRVSEWATGRRPVPRYIEAHIRTLDRLAECEERQ